MDSEGWIVSYEYLKDVRVEIDKPKLRDQFPNLQSDHPQIVQFGVTRWYNELAEEGITVNLTPEQARQLGNRLLVMYLEAKEKQGVSV